MRDIWTILLRKCCRCIFLYTLLSGALYAADDHSIVGRLTIESSGEKISEGDLVSAKLMLWPFSEANISSLQDHVRDVFLEDFYTVEVISSKFSEHNSEVLEVDLSLAVIKAVLPNSKKVFEYGDLKIPIEIRSGTIVPYEGKVKSFIIVEQGTLDNYTYYYLALLVLLAVLIVSIFIFRRARRSRMKQRNARKKLEESLNLLRTAETKEDLQLIHYNRNELMMALKDGRDFDEVLKVIDDYQYKNNVPKEVIEKLVNRIKVIASNGI